MREANSESDTLIFGKALVTGLEDDPTGALRVYVGAQGLYALVEDPVDQETICNAWASMVHVLVPMPQPDQLFVDYTVRPPLEM